MSFSISLFDDIVGISGELYKPAYSECVWKKEDEKLKMSKQCHTRGSHCLVRLHIVLLVGRSVVCLVPVCSCHTDTTPRISSAVCAPPKFYREKAGTSCRTHW